ncbi:alpha/beta fold hydrolase [Luteimonas sp. SJ-92]|uniref:Alpha/beta fold hydrolase n=1 Tax=Luteimonas salinisoli TaxID=2752307 RepID=A0A853JHX9_9GAMM|nr:alpha/beta fold hydrolase [Luteimonas salinisoli]NZA28028.1 alpha/beta fold hydrolase [Luteimonas salinisoli]
MNSVSPPAVADSATPPPTIPWIPDDWRTALLRSAMRALCLASPRAAERLVMRIWFTPPRLPLRPEGAAFLAGGERLPLRVHGRRVAAWSWGAERDPAVVLMHGWGGRAAQLRAFVPPLLARGLRVVAFDAPAHGGSAPSRLGGRRVSFLEFAAALREAEAAAGPFSGMIAHSSGCTAATLAVRDGWTPPPRMVFIAPFVNPQRYMAPFASALGISTAVMERFRARVEREFGRPWSDFEIMHLPQAHALPALLVVHDRDDAEVPIDDSEALAARWPQALLHRTAGLGHRRLLRDPSVVAAAVDAVAAEAQAVRGARAVPADGRDELDRYFAALERTR